MSTFVCIMDMVINMRKSLMKQIGYLLTIILILNCIVLFTIYFFVGQRAKEIDIEENVNRATIYANNIETRLKVSHEHLYDIALDIYDINGAYETSKELAFMEVKKIYDEMDEKLLVASNVNVYFAYDTILDQKILRANAYTGAHEVIAIKEKIFDYCRNNVSFLNDSNWSVVTINGIDYFYDAIHVGKYYVGMLSKVTNYGNDDSAELIEKFKASFIRFNGELYLLSGDQSMMEAIDNNSSEYLITEAKSTSKLVQLVSVSTPNSNIWQMETIVFLLTIESLVNLVLIVGLNIFTKHKIRYPLEKLIVANEQLANGNLEYRLPVQEADSAEFSNIYESYNTMVSQIGELKINQYEMRIQEEQNRLRMLRAQVKPHTFLNGITTISNMTYTQQPEAIRGYINAFAKFTRYMLHTTSEMTTVEKELDHIANYVELQRRKSAVNIELHVICEDVAKNYEIPLLMLYSLIENSFKHSLVSTRDMNIFIQCKEYEREDFKGIMIMVEDNGNGFSEEKLEQLTNMNENDEYTKEHLGLTNIKYTLNLLYKRNDLLELSNNLDGGARIVIFIPQKEENYEIIDM